jgi:hypothetical protein
MPSSAFVEQSRGDGREPEALLHHVDGDEEDGRDILLRTTLLAQRLKCPKLIEGMKSLGYASTVLLAVWR